MAIVHAGILHGEVGDDDAGRVGDARDRQIDLRAQDHKGEPDRDDPGDRDLRQDVRQVAERREGTAGGAEEDDQCEQRCERRDIAQLPMQPVRNTPRERRSRV